MIITVFGVEFSNPKRNNNADGGGQVSRRGQPQFSAKETQAAAQRSQVRPFSVFPHMVSVDYCDYPGLPKDDFQPNHFERNDYFFRVLHW